ncbi:hypothetical protein Q9189_001305 [Teloschistes chrysophthalmus]
MDDLLRAQVRKASQMVAATESWKQETTRGQELKRKDCLRPPRNRPDFYPSSQPSYAESSTSHGPQGSQPQGSSWYGPSNPTYSSNSSSSPVQQQQQQLGYGQYPPAQQTGHPYQETSTGYYPQQNPTTGQQPAYSPSNAAPNPYSYPGQRPATHGYPPSSTLQHSSPPPHFSRVTPSIKPRQPSLAVPVSATIKLSDLFSRFIWEFYIYHGKMSSWSTYDLMVLKSQYQF